jgi:hypothetical protein
LEKWFQEAAEMEKNKGIERLSDDFLDQVVGGAGGSGKWQQEADWKSGTVVGVPKSGPTNCLCMRSSPGGDYCFQYTWQVGYSIDVSPSSKQGSWIKARAYDGFTGWVDANCVRY